LPLYWSSADQQAWDVVERYVQTIETTPPERLKTLEWYYETTLQLGQEIARIYHPQAADPVANLRLPEILTAIELAAHDLHELVVTYVPGSHLLTVQHLRQAAQAVQWYRRLSNAYWAISGALSPLQTAARYLTHRVGVAPIQEKLLGQVLGWFAQAFVYRLGWYLIELHSGRLQVGADQYRRALAQGRVPVPWGQESPAGLGTLAPADVPPTRDATVRVLVVGQLKSGKSSLINALLGASPALTDVLTPTTGFAEYRRQYVLNENRTVSSSQGNPAAESASETVSLILVDSPSYPTAKSARHEVETFWQQVSQASIILLTLHALQASRQADREFLAELAQRTATPSTQPLVLGVLTHVDLLPPAGEWQPPYHWQEPHREKERQIAQAVNSIREELGLSEVFPVCTAAGRVWGVDELVAAVAAHLPRVQAQAVLATLLTQGQKHKWRRLFRQARSLLGQVWRVFRS
jgi:predicted GTPase